jgi:hypothetical protein
MVPAEAAMLSGMTETHRVNGPLLCELHSHTRWSDGVLSMEELVDLYGRNQFDVLCITDHVLRPDDPHGPMVDERNHAAYLEEVRANAERAAEVYGMIVIPGLELTYGDADPDVAAHAVAIGLERPVGLGDGLESALREARGMGAALIAAHPHGSEGDPIPLRTTRRFSRDLGTLRPLVDRFELINRWDVYGWVAAERLPAVASGDFHQPEHLWTWKTLIPCDRDPAAVVDHLRSGRPTFMTRVTETLAA